MTHLIHSKLINLYILKERLKIAYPECFRLAFIFVPDFEGFDILLPAILIDKSVLPPIHLETKLMAPFDKEDELLGLIQVQIFSTQISTDREI